MMTTSDQEECRYYGVWWAFLTGFQLPAGPLRLYGPTAVADSRLQSCIEGSKNIWAGLGFGVQELVFGRVLKGPVRRAYI